MWLRTGIVREFAQQLSSRAAIRGIIVVATCERSMQVLGTICIPNHDTYTVSEAAGQYPRTDAAVYGSQMEAAQMITAEIAHEHDVTILLELIIRQTTELLGTRLGIIYLWDAVTEAPRMCASYGFDTWSETLRLGEGLAGVVPQQRQGMIITDCQNSSYGGPIIQKCPHLSTILTEPLLSRDRLLGVIVLGREEPTRPSTATDQQRLGPFALQAAIAIENARLYEETERRRREAEVIAELAKQINASQDLDVMLQQVAEGVKELCKSDMGSVALRDMDSEAQAAVAIENARLLERERQQRQQLQTIMEINREITG